MFWKRKTNWKEVKTALLDLFTKEAEPACDLFEINKNERRSSYRIQPAKDTPVLFRWEDKSVEVKDISAAGLSFKNDACTLGDTLNVDLDLPGLGPAIPIEMEILVIDSYNRCHCKFSIIERSGCERIHQYVLNRQKDVVREIKELKKKNKSTIIRIPRDSDQDPASGTDI